MELEKQKGNNQQTSDATSQIDRLVKNLVGFLETHFKLIQIEVKNEVGNAITLLIVILSVAIFLGTAILLLSIGIAIWLGDWLESYGLGFILVASFYLLMVTIFALSFNSIKKRVNHSINQQIKKLEEKNTAD